MSDPQHVSDFGQEYQRLLLAIMDADDSNLRAMYERQLAKLIKANARKER